MAATITVTTAADPTKANVLAVAGLAGGTIVTLRRAYGSAPTVETIPGTLQADGSGALSYSDYLYPLDTPVTYRLYNSDGSALLATSSPSGSVQSGGQPWIRDLVFPALRIAPVRIIDITGRTRAARIQPFYVVARPYAVTVGDVRSGSTGSIQLYCQSHAERDAVLFATSSGNPCSLKLPTECHDVFDDMLFAPMDITEARIGTDGACVLTVDFVEVDMTDVATFQPVTYGIQQQNAAAAALKYGTLDTAQGGPSGLCDAFDLIGAAPGHPGTYTDMYLSPTGIAP